MFYTKAAKVINKFKGPKFQPLPRKLRVLAIGIPEGLQAALEPLIRQYNANVKYIADAYALQHEPRLSDVLLVCPLDMGSNRVLSQRLKKIRIQLRFDGFEGNNSAIQVMQLAMRVSTDPGSAAELKNRVDRFDAKWGNGDEALASLAAKEGEVLNADLAAVKAASATVADGASETRQGEAMVAVAQQVANKEGGNE